MMRTLVIVPTVFLSLSLVCSLVADDIEKLIELSLPEMLEQGQQWPHLTVAHSNQLPDDTDAEFIALNTLKKLRQYDRTVPLSLAKLEPTISLYAELSDFFSSAGGYYNLVLSDSCRRLIASRMGFELTNSNKDVDSLESSFSKVQPSLILNLRTADLLSALIWTGKKGDWNEIDVSTAAGLDAAWDVLQTTVSKVRHQVAVDPTLAQAETLIAKPSGSILLNNLCETDLVLSVHVPGTIAYLSNGGKFDEIDLADISGFKQVMGDDRSSYRFEPLSVKKLYASHISTMFKIFSDRNDYRDERISRIVF